MKKYLCLNLSVLCLTLLIGCTSLDAATVATAVPTATPIPEPTHTIQLGGRWVGVGGYELYLHCQGAGQLTIILESGFGHEGVPTWMSIQKELAEMTLTCDYDRAGLGMSDAGPTPRTTQDSLDDLHTLLQKAGIPAPYVLVGHSLGGFTVRQFADQYPDKVLGMILVDSSHEEQAVQLETLMSPELWEKERAFYVDNFEGINILESMDEVRDMGISHFHA